MSSRRLSHGTVRRRTLWAVAALVVAFLAGSVVPAGTASAAPQSASEQRPARALQLKGSDFNAGYIISDSLFFDGGAMTQSQIQSFLRSKVGACQNSYCLADARSSSKSKPADAMCNAFSGSSTETVAAIIYKVQKACGVSARVILVTLQKEQGLLTKSAPTSGAVRIAMGYGCPDTAACDTTYYGFFNQVYQAARQFKRYGMPGSSFNWYPIGQVSNVRYHPNASCGTKAVRIQNRATAALYYYTPYTPNAKALANLGTTGDSCSSYGNRNFWDYYNSWFGNSMGGAGDAAIALALEDAGGTAVMGTAVSPLANCGTKKSCYQRYTKGGIYWTAASGAFALTGAVWEEFVAQDYGSTLGYPIGPVVSVTGGSGQAFQSGSVYTSPAGTFSVLRPLRDVFFAKGSTSGPVGWPTGEQTCASGVCSQPFTGGIVFSKGGTGRVVSAEYATALTNAGGVAVLGMPVSDKVTITGTPNGDGHGQTFEKGTILSSSAGTFAVSGGTRTKYNALKSYLGALGWPAGDQVCDSLGCRQEFLHGTVYYSSALGGRAVLTAYDDVYQAAGGVGAMGLPLKDAVSIANPKNGNGRGQSFQNGTIYGSTGGLFAVIEPIRSAYTAKGSYLGALGWPTGVQTCSSTTCTQQFQHGTLTGAKPDDSDIMRYYISHGGASSALGAITGQAVALTAGGTSGFSQAFAKGTIYTSGFGTWAVLGPVRSEFLDNGGVSGALGWPAADQTCKSGECSQKFVNGMAFHSSAAGGRSISGSYYALYVASGGALGLGTPISKRISLASPNGAGHGQTFSNGTIYESAAGAFAVLKPLRDEYSRNGSYPGALGWPTAARECQAGDCTQTFQHGVVFSSSAGTASLSGAYADAYIAAGGVGTLGMPQGGLVTVPASANGGGTGRIFDSGTIYSSSAGTFAVYGELRDDYWARGSNPGVLGWPMSAQNCASGECSQRFTGGTLYRSATYGGRVLLADYRAVYEAAGDAAALGVPLADRVTVTGNPNGDGGGQQFATGTIYESAAGTFAVVKPLRDVYWAQGSNAGAYGWPISAQSCTGGVCTQQFQGGTITK